MYEHVLIATDGSELATKAVETGIELANLLKARLTVVTAMEPWSAAVGDAPAFAFPLEEYDKARIEKAQSILSAAASMAAKHGVACETVRVDDFPAEGIIETAKTRSCDLIVMGSHGRRGFARLLLGSQTARVVTLSTVPVLICR